jgi:flagellar protein FliT
MNGQEIISVYETVAGITDQMLNAARSGDWEQLVALETRCASQIAILKAEEPHPALTGEVRERKVRIIKKILEDDREIRNITEPWMAQLAALINSTGKTRQLSKAYGANTG